jgi:hypothetical protein
VVFGKNSTTTSKSGIEIAGRDVFALPPPLLNEVAAELEILKNKDTDEYATVLNGIRGLKVLASGGSYNNIPHSTSAVDIRRGRMRNIVVLACLNTMPRGSITPRALSHIFKKRGTHFY